MLRHLQVMMVVVSVTGAMDTHHALTRSLGGYALSLHRESEIAKHFCFLGLELLCMRWDANNQDKGRPTRCSVLCFSNRIHPAPHDREHVHTCMLSYSYGHPDVSQSMKQFTSKLSVNVRSFIRSLTHSLTHFGWSIGIERDDLFYCDLRS